jgi:hypothetical protein
MDSVSVLYRLRGSCVWSVMVSGLLPALLILGLLREAGFLTESLILAQDERWRRA